MTQTSVPSPVDPWPVLLTRPAAASAKTARALTKALGADGARLRVVIAPILDIVTLPLSTSLDSDAALLLTSAHALEALAPGDLAAGQRAYCVGATTAEAARAAGLEALSADGDATDLVRLVQQQHDSGPLVWLRGRHRRADLGDRLRQAGYDVSEIVVYDQQERPLTQEAFALLQGTDPVVLPLYSPRSAGLLGEACAKATAPLHLVAISPAALQGWCGPGPRGTHLAERPDGPSMLAAILCGVSASHSG